MDAYTIDQQAIEATVAFIDDILRDAYIVDPDVKRAIARNLLNEASVVDDVSGVAELIGMISGEVTSGNPYGEVRKNKVYVNTGLNTYQKAALVNRNDDVDIEFKDSPKMPHGMAYAQRTIDTQSFRSEIPPGVPFVDVGGNWSIYASPTSLLDAHCCNMRVGEREEARQVFREVSTAVQGMSVPDSLKCFNGVENCDVTAERGFSVHTLPNIAPSLWTDIFKRHKFSTVKHVFHYDPAMELCDRGYIDEAEMYWEDRGHEVFFHFDNDSSHGYSHRKEWLLQYARPFYITDDTVDFVVTYTVDAVRNGNVYSTMVKLQKNTLGQQDKSDYFRFRPLYDAYDLVVPEYSAGTGYPMTDPRGYVQNTIRVEGGMFRHVYQKGISNDSFNLDKPLALTDVREAVDAYNAYRKVNGTTLTVDVKLSFEDKERIALGMYLAIVYDAARQRVVIGRATTHIKELQHRWGATGLFWMFTRLSSQYASLAFAALTTGFEEAVATVVASMRVSLSDHWPRATYTRVSPCRTLSTVHFAPGEEPTIPVVKDSRATGAVGQEPGKGEEFDMQDPADVKKFYDMYSDMMPADLRTMIATFLEEKLGSADRMAGEDVPSEGDASSQPLHMPDVPEDLSMDDVLDAMQTFSSGTEAMSAKPDGVMQEGDQDHVNESVSEAIYEFGMTKFDEGLHELNSAREYCKRTFDALQRKPDYAATSRINQAEDAGVAWHDVDGDGVISGMTVEDAFAVVLSPFDVPFPYYKVNKSKDGKCYIVEKGVHLVFVCASLQIFNSIEIGRKAIEFVKRRTALHNVDLHLVNAVAGAGKTHSIVNEFTLNDVILCTVRSTADDTREWLKKLEAPSGDDSAKGTVSVLKFQGMEKAIESRVRTVDSAILHGMPRAATLYVDEGLMVHAGAIRLVSQLSKARVVKVYGDETQIQYIQRGSKLFASRFESLFYWTQMTMVNETIRCPADATFIHSLFHSENRRGSIRTFSPVKRSITFRYEPSVEGAAYKKAVPGWTVASILRGDRYLMVKQPGFCDGKIKEHAPFLVEVLSIHETQGKTVARLKVVRINAKTVGTLGSRPHLNVAFTRHTLRMHVVSTVMNDPLGELARQAEQLSEEQLLGVMLPAPQWLRDRLVKQAETVSETVEFHIV